MSTKSDLLNIFEQNRGRVLSGEELAAGLGVTRAAVWKGVQALREDGHEIRAEKNRGYCLNRDSDILSPSGVRLYLEKRYRDCSIAVYQTVDSTNTEAKRLALGGAPDGTILLSEEQTAGRGRYGKTFFSPRRTGLYMSLLLRPEDGVSDAQLVTAAVAVAVCRAIEKTSDLKTRIKWVNDIFLDGKKICGILTEAVTNFESGQIETLVIGIGINCRTPEESFPDELTDIARSLSVPGLTRNRLAAEVIGEVFACLREKNSPEILSDYRSRSLVLGREITYEKEGRLQTGKAVAINDWGNLVVETPEGTDCLFSGEVTIRSSFYEPE